MNIIYGPRHIKLYLLSVVCDGVVHAQEQHVFLACRELEHLLTLFHDLGCGELFAARPLLVVLTRTSENMKKNLC